MRMLFASVAMSCTLFSAGPALLGGELIFAGHGHGKGGNVCCPACNYVCEFTTEKSTETKTCYDVECEPICIPPITFPWEKGHGKGDCCPTNARCGKVKVVRVLVKQEYECSRCKCVWTAVHVNGKDKGRIGGGGGVGSGYDSDQDVPPPPALEARRLRQPIPLQAVRFEAPIRENVAPPTAAKRSLTEVFTGFFK